MKNLRIWKNSFLRIRSVKKIIIFLNKHCTNITHAHVPPHPRAGIHIFTRKQSIYFLCVTWSVSFLATPAIFIYSSSGILTYTLDITKGNLIIGKKRNERTNGLWYVSAKPKRRSSSLPALINTRSGKRKRKNFTWKTTTQADAT